MAKRKSKPPLKMVRASAVLAVIDSETSRTGPIGVDSWELIARLRKLCRTGKTPDLVFMRREDFDAFDAADPSTLKYFALLNKLRPSLVSGA